MSEVDAINPNVNVTSNLTSDGKIEADATGGPLSFDDLEELTLKSKRSKSEKKEEKVEEKTKTEKSKDLTSDTDKGKKAEKSEKQEPKSDGKKEGEEPEVPARKTIKAKYADNDVELDEEAAFTVKVNGQEVPVTVKELMNNYSGKVGWDKKFSEIDQVRKRVAAQEMKLRESSDAIKAIFEEQDPNIKMYRMATLAGVDPVQFRQNFFDEQISLLEKYHSMSEDERKADAAAYEAAMHKHRADTLEKSAKEKQDYESLQTKVSQLRASHQISEQEFVAQYDRILEYVESGKGTKELLTPEFIASSIVKDRMWNAAEEKLQGLELGWNQQTKAEKLNKLVEHAHQLNLSPQDVAEMVDELWGIKKAQNKIEQKKAENKEFLSGKKDVIQAKADKAEAVFFDEM